MMINRFMRSPIALCLCFFTLIACTARAEARALPPDTTLAFISDTQAPIIFEELRLRPDRNREATRALFHDMVSHPPGRLFLLGDIVSLGFYDTEWKSVDRFLDSLRREGTPADAVLGNHELMIFPGTGERNFQARFPDASRTGYVRTTDSVAVVLLNSNLSNLGAEGARAQESWYTRTLDSLDRDSSVLAVIVCCHHSPYSRSTIVGSAMNVREEFVPPFLASGKARLFLSGHAHAFEHFRVSGKDFLVIGGGGGLLQPLADADTTLPEDIAPVPRPRYHYLLVTRHGRMLDAVARSLQPDFSTFIDVPCPLRCDAPVSAPEGRR